MLRKLMGIIATITIILLLISSNGINSLIINSINSDEREYSTETPILPESLPTNEILEKLNTIDNQQQIENQEPLGIIKETRIEESMSNKDPKLDQSPIMSEQTKVSTKTENDNMENYSDYPVYINQKETIEKNNKKIGPTQIVTKTSTSQQLPEPSAKPTSAVSKSLYEQDFTGGSWLDTFEDDLGIDWVVSDSVLVYGGDAKIKPAKILNSDLEAGTLGGIPNNWIREDYSNGPGVFKRELKLVEDRYYSGKRSAYIMSNGSSDGTKNSHGCLTNLTMDRYINIQGATKVGFFVSNISFTHSYPGWGWNVNIYIRITDGVITKGKWLFWNGEESGGTQNRYHKKVTGKDGKTWYQYLYEIPNEINKSHVKIKIRIHGGCWTITKGTFSRMSCNVDKPYLDGPQIVNAISKNITKPTEMAWDTLIINKTQIPNTYLNVTILNATDNKPIPGAPIYINDGEFDISYIDPLKYPAIKLKGELKGNMTLTPILHYWGVSWNATNAWRDSLFGGKKCTIQNLSYGDGEVWLETSYTDFIKYSNNPILKPGPGSTWDNNRVVSPSVLFNGTGYMMYFRGGNTVRGIGIATSVDGITWSKYTSNPVLAPTPSAWDSFDVNNPCVFYDGTLYKMWYSGQDSANDRRIGYATSTDGYNWIKHPNNPVLDLGSIGQWDSHYAQNPFVIFENGIYKMWYIGLGTPTNYQLGYATSPDGINWTKYPTNPIIHSSIGFYDGIISMFVIPTKYEYLGWYELGDGTGNSIREIYHATSNDGITWINYTNNPVLKRGASSSWDDIFVGHANIHYIKKQYYMYYHGNSGSTMQIGLAKSKFSSFGSLNSTIINLPKDFTFDKLIINKTEPTGTFINISIIDANTNKFIPGFNELRTNNIDISQLALKGISKIRLIANFSSNQLATPILYNWAVTWQPLPTPEVNASGPYYGYESYPVELKANCTTEHPLLKFEYRWDLDNDGMFDTPWSTSPNYNYTWDDDHTGTIAVQVRDNLNRTADNKTLIIVSNLSPSVSAGSDQTINESQSAKFKGFYFDPGTLDTHTIYWDFGDGNSSSGALTTSHNYPQAGVYNVVLTVKDDDGGTSSDNLTLIVGNLIPIVDAGPDKTVDEAESFTLNGTIQNPGNDTLFYFWDFDITADGPDADTIPDNDLDSYLLNVTHVYTHNGTYMAKLFVKDDEDSVVVDYIMITVNDLSPAADFAWSPKPQNEGAPVQFNDTSTSYPDAIVSWLWEFGDGNTSSQRNITHTYADNGVYTVKLIVTDDDSSTGEISYKITILNVAPVANAGIDHEAQEGSTLDFKGTCFDPGIFDTYTYAWDFDYDGTMFNVDAIGQEVSHTWPDDFNGTVALRVTDDDAGAGLDTCHVLVKNVPPTVELKVLPISVNISIRITGEKWRDIEAELYDGDLIITKGNLTRYPGNPNEQMLNLTTLEANLTGNYNLIIRYTPEDDLVNCKSKGKCKCKSKGGATPCWVILSYGEGKEVKLHHTFKVKHTKTHVWKVDLTTEIYFTNITFEAKVYDPGADDLTFFWDFGDGTNMTKFYPNINNTYPVEIVAQITHYYPKAGTYNVTLIVTDDDGGVDSDSVFGGVRGVEHWCGYIAYEDLKNQDWCDYDYNDWGMLMQVKTAYDTDGNISEMEMEFVGMLKLAGYDHRIHLGIGIDSAVQYTWGAWHYNKKDIMYWYDTGTGCGDLNITLFNYTDCNVDYSVLLKIKFLKPIDPGLVADIPFDPYMYVFNIKDDIHVGYNQTISIEDAKGSNPFIGLNESPLILIVELDDWTPPKECQRIWKAYPYFDDWIYSKRTKYLDWYKHPSA